MRAKNVLVGHALMIYHGTAYDLPPRPVTIYLVLYPKTAYDLPMGCFRGCVDKGVLNGTLLI
eukprot:832376-Amphidinium_carterae.1